MDAPGSDAEPQSWTARVLVWLAFLVTVALAILIASGEIGGLDSDDEGDERPVATTTGTEEGDCNPPADNALKLGYYILKPGEPGLSGVGARTCMTVEELTTLNPELDPQAIPVGACINLRQEGCAER